MAWVAALGYAVVGAFTTTAVSVGVAMAVGGAIIGAAVGAMYSAWKGGNILKGALFGAVGGAVLGYGAAALGAGGAAAGASAGGAAGTAAPSAAAVQGASTTGVLSGTTGANVATASAAGAKSAGFWSTSSNVWNAIGAAGSLGSAFVQGGNTVDPDAAQSFREKEAQKNRDLEAALAEGRNATTIAAAEMSLAGTREQIAANEKKAADDLAFAKEKFNKEFDESQWRDRADREKVAADQAAFKEEVKQGSTFVKTNTKTASLVDSFRRRKQFPAPTWKVNTSQQPTTTADAAGQQQPTGVLSGGNA